MFSCGINNLKYKYEKCVNLKQNIMSYYKTKKKYDDMNLNELLEAKQRHITNPKYYLKLVKPPFYYTWLNLLETKINKKMKSVFKEIEKDLPSGIKEMMAYALYDNKNKLQAILSYLEKEKVKNSNIRNSIDHLNYILKEYYHDTKSFKDGQKEHLSN